MKLFLKRARILPILLFFFLIAGNAAAEGPKEINTEKNPLHRSVFALPVYVVLPESCSFVKSHAGCVDKTKKVSLESSVIRLPYSALLEEFTEENLKKASMELKMKNEFIWNGSSAMLMKIFQKKGSSLVGKWALVVDRGEECWMINGLYPAGDQSCGEAVLKTIKSAYWENEKSSFPIEIPQGNVEVNGTPLKLASLLEGAVVYTKDGFLPTKKDDGSLFVVSRLSNIFVTPDKQLGFAKEKLQMIEKGEKVDIISEKTVMIDGLTGIEIIGYTAGEQTKLIYQTMLFDGKNSHVMVGIARSAIPENLDLFHSTAETFKTAR